MKKLLYIFFIALVISCVKSSGDVKDDTEKKERAKDGVNRSYHPNGKLRSEIPIQDGKKNGLARDYYSDGKIRLEVEYVNSIRQGTARMYYQNGNLYEETPYYNDLIHGIQKRFREDGKLSAEAPFLRGAPCLGLKEYLVDGSPKKNYPTIVVTPVNNLLKEGKYTLRLTMSDNTKNVTFYQGALVQDCLPASLEQVYETPQKGVSEINYYLSPGMYAMEELNIVAKVKTLQGNTYITQRKYNVAIENR